MLYDKRDAPRRLSKEEMEWRKDRMTLDRAFSRAGVMSRSDAVDRIVAGRVVVNDTIVTEPGTWVSPGEDRIACDGRKLRFRKRVYFALHKPVGFVTSYGDPEGRRTIYELLPSETGWVFPVGRLDKSTSGLLILTNDADFGDALADPDSGVPKTYLLTVNFEPSPEQLESLRTGVVLKDGYRTGPSAVAFVGRERGKVILEMVLHEGKNRQIRRMIESLGGKVLTLARTHIGGLALGDLTIGSCRKLEPEELALLMPPVPPDGGPAAGSGEQE